jgi:hypothetical protein
VAARERLTRNADIFELADGGHPQRAIANICGISQKQVSKILQRRADTLANARVSLIPKSIPLGDTYPQVSPQVSPEVSPPSETKNANDNNDDTLANAEVSPPNILKESTSFSLSKEVLTGEERYDSRDIGHSQEIGGLESDDTPVFDDTDCWQCGDEPADSSDMRAVDWAGVLQEIRRKPTPVEKVFAQHRKPESELTPEDVADML